MEIEATQQGVENSQTEAPQGEADAGLLEAYLAHEDENQVDDSGEAGTPAQADTQPAKDDLFTVKIDGEELQVSRDDLISHYQKGKASEKRFEEAAAIRQQAQTQLQQFQSQQQMLSNAIQHFETVASQFNIKPPSLELLENNPHEYLRQEAQYKQFQGELQKAQAAKAYLEQQQSAQQQEFMQQHLAQEGQKLLDLMPEWKDQAVRGKDERDLVDFLYKQGYTQQDIMALNQSKASNIKLALNAMRYERLVNQAKSTGKQVQKLPPRMEKPGVQQQVAGDREQAMQRLGKTGRVEDAAAVLAHYFT